MPNNSQYLNNLNPKEESDFRNLDEAVSNLFTYQPWTAEQEVAGNEVRTALMQAYKTIVANVPSGPTRTVALRKLVEARMDANAAITFNGAF